MKEEEIKKTILKAEKEAEKLLESRTFTPVTKESFAVFYKKFYDKHCKKSKLVLEQQARITGREFFMLAKNKDLNESIDDDDIQEEVVDKTEKKNEFDFDEEAFNVDDNLDDLDFDDDEDC